MNELEKITFDRRRISKSILHNARSFIIIFIIFVVIVVMTTDIRFITAADVADLGLDFFMILFCSYAMYVCCADSGTQAGGASEEYKRALERFSTLKKEIIESTLHTRVRDFCSHYITEDIREARMQYLSIAGIAYDDYVAKYSKLDKERIDKLGDLSEIQKSLIKKANKVRPIKLTPVMILRQGRSIHRRSPLGFSPLMKKNFVFGWKFAQMSVISVCMSVIALDVILEPSWVVFASICLKLASVIINGFGGYKAGYDNIAVDTVNYLDGQSDLMEQAIRWIRTQPIAGTATTTND